MRRTALAAGVIALALAGCGSHAPGYKTVEYLYALGPAPNGEDPALAHNGDSILAYALTRALYLDRLRAAPAPDLAAGAPTISRDRRTVTVRLRRGVRYSPPVSREFVAADVKYGISRLFMKSVGGDPGVFAGLEGAAAFQAGRAKQISGIQTPDPHTVVFRLTAPNGPYFAAGLIDWSTAPVPPEYARPFDRKAPSTYAQHVVTTAPYMPEHDRSGKVIVRNNRLRLVRNPNWRRASDLRPAALDEIDIRAGFTELAVIARKIVRGRHLAFSGPLSPAAVAQFSGPRARLLESELVRAAFVVSMNTRIAPLDDVDVRRAIVAGFDRAAALGALGGRANGRVATHFIAPGMTGYAEAGGAAGTGADFLRAPSGDLDVARAYLRRAGYPSGRYTGRQKLRFLAVRGTYHAISDVARAQLEKLGFRLQVVELDPMHAVGECGQLKVGAALCFTNVFAGFADPQALLEPSFHGHSIRRHSYSTNTSQLDDPQVNAAMDRAAAAGGRAERAAAWAAVDRMVVALAPVVPMVWERSPALRSPDLAPLLSRFTGQPDPGWWDTR